MLSLQISVQYFTTVAKVMDLNPIQHFHFVSTSTDLESNLLASLSKKPERISNLSAMSSGMSVWLPRHKETLKEF